MEIKTEILQKMVSKAIQGSLFNKMIPLTSLMGISVKRDLLTPDKSIITLTTTDGSNQLNIHETITNAEDFYTIVNADLFAKLVGKTTKEYIVLENKENYLEVIGNGTYKLEIAINEEGEMVTFPTLVDYIPTESVKINLNDLQESIKVAKASVAKTMEVPCLTGYYISNNMITTDRQMMCSIENKLVETPILISSEMAELLLLVEGDKELNLVKENNDILFYNINYTIIGKELEGKDTYPVNAINDLLQVNYANILKVNKQEFLNVLDRMNLFVTDYDKGGIYLTFGKDGLTIRSQKSNAEETISIKSDNELVEFNCLADIEMLKAQIETISTDEVEIHYGEEKSIKIIDGNTNHIISLLDKEN